MLFSKFNFRSELLRFANNEKPILVKQNRGKKPRPGRCMETVLGDPADEASLARLRHKRPGVTWPPLGWTGEV